MSDPKALAAAWAWYCNGCGLPAKLPREGRWHCPHCGDPLWLTLPERGGPQLLGGTAVPLIPEKPPLDAACATHPAWRAAGVCDRCGDFRCNPCTRVLEGRFYCVDCFAGLKRPSGFRTTMGRYPHVVTMAGLALLVLVVQLALRFLNLVP